HLPHWLRLADGDSDGVPLFVSDRRLRRYRRLPRAVTWWALDSGGFTELARHGSWDHGPTPAAYAARIRRYRDEIGHLAWAAPQDQCEPWIVAKTVVQGHTDYLACVEAYHRAGVDLTRAPLVGVGTLCRRQATTQVGDILTTLHRAGATRLHGF